MESNQDQQRYILTSTAALGFHEEEVIPQAGESWSGIWIKKQQPQQRWRGGNDGIRRRRGATNSIKSFLKTLGGGRLPFPLNNNKQTATLINYTLEYYCISQTQIMLMRRGFFVVPELSLFEFHGSGGMWFCCSMMVM